MRWMLLVLLGLFLAGCASTNVYSSNDLRQVNQGYHELLPIYKGFKSAFRKNDGSGIRYWHQREHQPCYHLVDEIDKRDTIDSNVKLFHASATLDSWCDDIEYAYAGWAKRHHLPYDHSLSPGRPQDAFIDGDFNLKIIPGDLRHPSTVS